MVSSTTKVLILLFLVKLILNTGVFRFDPRAERGDPIYYFYLEEQSQCLRACYDEIECKIVEYFETNGYCRLYREGTVGLVTVEGYKLTRDETDSSCMTETSTSDIVFQKIPPRPNNTMFTCVKLRKSDVTIIEPFEREKYLFFFTTTSKTPSEWTAKKPRLFLSKKADETCASVPVFHKANHRRLFFGEIYNTTGYYFFNGYAFADRCVSPEDKCLGVIEIQEYKDKHGNFFYDTAGKDFEESDLGQTFYIAKIG